MPTNDTNKPRLLIVAEWYTPGFKAGGPIRSIQNLVDLLKNDFQIFVFTADRDHGNDAAYKDVVFNKWERLNDHEVFYADRAHLTVTFFKQMIQQIKPGAVFLNSMFAYRFFLLPLIALSQIGFKGKIILAPRGMLRSSALHYKKFKKGIFLFILKHSGLLKSVVFQATNIEESKEIKSILKAKADQVQIIENVPFAGGIETPIEKLPGELNLIYLGRIHPIKGLDFLLDLLRDTRDKINLDIIGTIENKEYFAACQSKIRMLPASVKVDVQQEMPFEKAIDRIYKSHFLISPTHGENFGHAIFESFAAGRPVIISDQTPWRNLEENKTGWDIPLKNISNFKQAIATAASLDQEQFNQFAHNARQFSLDYISHSNLKGKYITLFTSNTQGSQS